MTIQQLGNNKYNLTKKGITAVVSNVLSVQESADGNFLIQEGPGGALLESYTPAYNGNNGAVKNIRGNNNLINAHRNKLTLPALLSAGDATIITKAAAVPGTSPKDNYWPGMTGMSEVDEMMTIVTVSYMLDNNIPLLRPPAIGDGIIAKFFRSLPIPEANIQYSKLPSIINLNAIANKPSLALLERLFSDFSGDIYGDWECLTRIPDMQHMGYGTYFAGAVSSALVYLCSTIPVEQKKKLARSIVQWGLDYAGAWGDGRRNYSNGGHMQGRKALLIMAGHLLDVYPLTNPTQTIGSPVFQEDMAFYKDNPAWWFGWQYGWRYNSDIQGKFLQKPPSQWTAGQGSQTWGVTGYLEHVCGCQVGTALAMQLMGLSYEMGESFMGAIKQWMEGPPADARQQLMSLGINLPWGRSYAIGLPDQFCAEAWRNHYPQ